ncbi:MAG: type II CRISPR RNA-guided endonuclease Cas9 [Salinivirgaceae bacterium]
MKTLGIDLGTNSIGLTVREPDNSVKIEEQLEYYCSTIFKTGAGKDDKGFTTKSYAAERTRKRSVRHLYQSRKFRIWETLKVLIENDNYKFCPLSKIDLEKWSKYDKTKGLKRQYPIHAVAFEQWVRLDFNGDGVADYSSPYQLRAELINNQFDFANENDRFKLGRALYHIAQRRGFKSSKGETIKEQEEAFDEDFTENEIDLAFELKKSEEKKAKELSKLIIDNNCKTVGEAFALLENKGERIRASVYEAVRSQYLHEIIEIFKFQNGLDLNNDFYKKAHKAIFFVNPLKSQKGLVGKCTLEPSKSRCPVSHPDFEEFRAWSFINTIQYRKTSQDDWSNLTLEEKKELFTEKFMRMASSFKFEEITHWIEKKKGYKLSQKGKTINYKEKTSVSGCPISARLNDLLGEDWKTISIKTKNERINQKTEEVHTVAYNYEDFWHICLSYDDSEKVQEFAKSKLQYDPLNAGKFVRTWGAVQQGYSMLSLKAIRNINIFLKQGLIYTDAVLLAKLPEILGADNWQMQQQNITNAIGRITESNRREKRLYNIVNSLISRWKSLEYNEELHYDEKFAKYDFDYLLKDSDLKDIDDSIIENFGKNTWANLQQNEKGAVSLFVKEKYQKFFLSKDRDYYKLPKLGEALKKYISDSIPEFHCENNFFDTTTKLPCNCEACKKLNKLYHPSQIEFYAPAKEVEIDHNGVLLSKKLLESPVIGAFKNPMAMRSLHILRKQINNLLIEGIIDEDTRIVVETAKDLNDANMRWAIETYQRERENENKEYETAIIELLKDTEFTGNANPNNLDDISKFRLWIEMSKDEMVSKLNSKGKPIATTEQSWKTFGNTTRKFMLEILKCKTDMIKKYRLWKEQNFLCIYTGKPINIFSLFSENSTDFEHTIPRSMSFDNSLANLTICDSYYNRKIKLNQIPTQLPNYDKNYSINGREYTAILPRLDHWKEKVEHLKDNVDFWKARSKRAQDKDQKDNAIRQKHLWQMELNYWKNKVERFTMEEVNSGFKNSQLVDTRIISKYAYHYLKSVFNKVEVQKGSVTSDFRKMLGIQSMDEKKDRSKHSHHAIDAAILSIIPSSAKRDKMLELFYKKEEYEKYGWNIDAIIEELEKEKRSCKIGSIKNLPKFIEENILINHVSKDQTLTPAKKAIRVRGKIVPLKKDGKIVYQTNPDGTIRYRIHKDGSIMYKRNENGEFIIENGEKVPIPIPVAMYKSGDVLRGQLHGESFYGAITQVQKDENGKFLRDNEGNLIVGEQIYYVKREELKHKKNAQDKGFANLEELEKAMVDKALFKQIQNQFEEMKKENDKFSFANACENGFYMLNKNGKKENKIRRVRCFKPNIKKPLIIKQHTYLSNKKHKQNYYAEVGDLYVMCKYVSEDETVKEFKIYSLYDLSENRKFGIEDIPKKLVSKKNKIHLVLKQILKTGISILIYDKNIENLKELSKSDIIKRLYIIRGFENDGMRVILVSNISAKPDKDLGKGESIKDFNDLPEKIRCGINTLDFLIEGKEFTITNSNTIDFRF